MPTFLAHDPHATTIAFDGDDLLVQLEDGRRLSVPLAWFPRLLAASDAERQDWRLMGRGLGIHWEQLDEDLSVPALLATTTRP